MQAERETQAFADAFGQQVRSLRKSRGLTQLDLAAKMDVTDRLIQRIEAGDGYTTIKTAYLIAQAFGVSVSELFAFNPPQAETPPN